ncbi:MAG: bifunctional folylpolyglutamate synthase/dihydrofolate synthase [Candidatus Eisenbacteria bacterium]|nr:bifunctional folylpolyglutamate synthase/dihydrofolate synthase [Candidatus Eisenbacteria bacterium]MCC7144134.1 bifunctional folylpolyglutamate synthase/dihydrofolate synthase [Candidatus Eisenbacteria bacterium]
MSYAATTAYLFGLESRGIKLDLDRMRAAEQALGHPEQAFPSILVAGTNGKGSTSTLLASVLELGGRRVGLYTSPHLLDFRERIRVDGRMIEPEAVVARVAADREVWERYELSFFEATTLLALSYFRDRAVDLAVLEVGMGGRLDATNTAEPILSVVTALGMDHAQVLGDTPAKIAREKAGIFRSGVPAVAAGGPLTATAALRQVAAEMRTPLRLRREWVAVNELRRDSEGTVFAVRARGARGLKAAPLRLRTPLRGGHQVGNAALATLALWTLREQGLEISDPAIASGFSRARWPGRLERPRPDLELLADAAHNREGARVVAESLASEARRREIRLVAGMVEGKDHLGFFREMRRLSTRVWIGAPRTPRAMPPEALAAAARSAGFETTTFGSVRAALEGALAGTGTPDGPLVLLAGSFFTLEEGYRSLDIGPMESLWHSS